MTMGVPQLARLVPHDIQPAYPRDLPREAVRGELLELLGVQEIPDDLDFTIDRAQETGDGLYVSGVTYPNSLGDTVPWEVVELGSGSDGVEE